MAQDVLPNIVLLATGGTIAATAASTTALTDYRVTEGIAALLKAVPQIAKLARVHGRQFSNVDSRAFNNKMLVRIANSINKLLASPDVDGVVVTHGTDTLEETAYFLNLTVKSGKPVVVVGAMRPASALSADGPLNLYNAVLVATHPEAGGRGVMVAMNDQIHAARFVTKANTTQVDAFRSPDHGCLGQINNGRVHFLQTATRAHTTQTRLELTTGQPLPAVDIIYDHQDAAIHHFQASIAAGTQGIVIAGMGNGSLSPQARKGGRLAIKNGLVCVRSSRTGSGIVSPSVDDAKSGLISADSLNPQKARILLMLALQATTDRALIQEYFDRY